LIHARTTQVGAQEVDDDHMEDGQAAEDRAANTAGFSGRLGPQQLIDRTDYLRLLQQAMRKLGYRAAADHLERESVSLRVSLLLPLATV